MFRLYEPHFTLAKIWLARDSSISRHRAADLLDELRKYIESTNNTVCLIQVLALQAILLAGQGDESAALNLTRKALELGQPGGFIRLFVDLGPPIARLLQALSRQGVSPDYTSRILAAFAESAVAQKHLINSSIRQPSSSVVDSLTPRELEVLELLARRLTNKEIAGKLVVSPGTVKTHTLSIYAKLDVHSRRQAVEKAQELNLLPQT
jgi:LuxR family maltose regulon positive regulatory protein